MTRENGRIRRERRRGREGIGDVIALPPLPEGDLETATALFKSQYAEKIEAAVLTDPMYQKVLDAHPKLQAKDKNLSAVQRIIYERELHFCRHVIGRVGEILQQAQTEEFTTIAFSTTVFSDVDETLGTRVDKDNWHIRCSARFLLQFLRQHFPNLRIGLITSRAAEYLDAQLKDPNTAGTLQPIADLIDQDSVIAIAAYGDLMKMSNSDQYDASLFPNQTMFDAQEALSNLGWGETEIRNFATDEAAQRVVQYVLSYTKFCEQSAVLLAELHSTMQQAMQRRKQELIAADWFKDDYDTRIQMEQQVQAYTEELHRQKMPDFSARKKMLKSQWIQGSTEVSADDVQAFCGELNSVTFFDFLRNALHVTSEINGFQVEPGSSLEEQKSTALEAFLPFKQLYFSVDRARLKIANGNEEERIQFLEKIELALDPRAAVKEGTNADIDEMVQRIAAAKRMIDQGVTKVSIALDNDELAEQFDQLLSGKIHDPDGAVIDGYALLNIAAYRNKIFVISCGQRGAYDYKEVVAEVLAA